MSKVPRTVTSQEREIIMMKPIRTSLILALGLLATAGCSSWQSMCTDTIKLIPSDSLQYSNCPPPPPPPPSLRDQLAAAQKQNAMLSSRVSDLERQLADRDREIASLRSGAGDSSRSASQLSSAQRELNQSNARAADLERQLAASQALAAGGLATDKQRIADLEKQLAERDKELDGLRGELSAEMTKLKEAQRGLIRALRPQIEKGDITVDLNNERLLINLASRYLFGSGQDELKPAGADALKHVGAVLKDFSEYKVAVDGHTDNVPIRGALKKKFPTNMALSESRATNAAKALTKGGLGATTTHGYADTKPVEPNTTDVGRAKNRRVEVRVTK
jgi:chemotaxis protein MotB